MEEIAAELSEIGAEYSGEDMEENIIFSNDELYEKRAIIRIRKTDNVTKLTFKQRIESISDTKQQIEHETTVEDADVIRTILEAIGLRAAIVYEKRRKTYRCRDTEVVLDELPFGWFVEIEGSLTSIAEVEMLLGLEDLEVELNTYPRLTAAHGTRNGEVIEARFPAC